MLIDDYRVKNKLKVVDLAKLLSISKGHASELCSGKHPVSVKVAKRLAKITGEPWWKYVDAKEAPAPAGAAQ